ncbi:hypothetical protein THAOC_11691, partial [Thalassiosira oceanica]
EKDFSVKELAQLHQWQLLQQELKYGVELPQSLQEKCRNAFTSASFSESKLQNDVVYELRAAGLDLDEEVLLGSGYRVDALVKFSNGRKVAVEVDGPSHFIDRRPTGSSTLKHRQVARLDRIEVVSVPYWEWNELKNSETKQRYLQYTVLGMMQPWMLLVTSLSKMRNVGLAPFTDGPVVLPLSAPPDPIEVQAAGVINEDVCGLLLVLEVVQPQHDRRDPICGRQALLDPRRGRHGVRLARAGCARVRPFRHGEERSGVHRRVGAECELVERAYRRQVHSDTAARRVGVDVQPDRAECRTGHHAGTARLWGETLFQTRASASRAPGPLNSPATLWTVRGRDTLPNRTENVAPRVAPRATCGDARHEGEGRVAAERSSPRTNEDGDRPRGGGGRVRPARSLPWARPLPLAASSRARRRTVLPSSAAAKHCFRLLCTSSVASEFGPRISVAPHPRPAVAVLAIPDVPAGFTRRMSTSPVKPSRLVASSLGRAAHDGSRARSAPRHVWAARARCRGNVERVEETGMPQRKLEASWQTKQNE